MKTLLLMMIATLGFNAHAGKYEVDAAHSKMGFEVAHLMISTVEGRFTDFSGELTYDEKKEILTAIKGTAKATSIDTANAKRDEHLRSPDFFDVAKYPELSFSASGLKVKKGEKATIKGKLTIHGKTKTVPVELNFKGIIKDAWGNDKLVVSADAKISRKDFGLTWNKALEAGGVVVGDEVEIKVVTQAALPQEKK